MEHQDSFSNEPWFPHARREAFSLELGDLSPLSTAVAKGIDEGAFALLLVAAAEGSPPRPVGYLQAHLCSRDCVRIRALYVQELRCSLGLLAVR